MLVRTPQRILFGFQCNKKERERKREQDSQGGEDKEEADADDECDGSLDDKDPAPAIIPSNTIHCSVVS